MTEQEFIELTARLEKLDALNEINAEDWTEAMTIACLFQAALADHFVPEEYDGHPH